MALRRNDSLDPTGGRQSETGPAPIHLPLLLVVVRYRRQSDGIGRCGMIQGTLITIYAYARDARGRAIGRGPPAVNLVHEIGRFLGLRDIATAPGVGPTSWPA